MLPWQMTDEQRSQIADNLSNQDVASVVYARQPTTNAELNVDNALGVSGLVGDGASQINHQMYNTKSVGQVSLDAKVRGLETAVSDNVKAN